MKRERQHRNSARTENSSMTSSIFSVGDHNRNLTTSSNYRSSAPTDTADTLRDRLSAERDNIEAAVSDPEERQEVAEAIDRIMRTLAADRPDPAGVRRRWSVVRSVLTGGATVSTALAKVVEDISGMVTALFPTS